MREKYNILQYFHEDTDQGMRDEILNGLNPEEKAQFDLLNLIWEEAGNAEEYASYNSEAAWSNVSAGMRDSTEDGREELHVVVEEVAQEEKPPRGKVIPLRRYAVAAAAVLVLIVASRFLLDEDITSPDPVRKTFVSLELAREYAFEKMFPLAEYLLQSAQSDEFENRVYAMAGQRFDGETNVLVQDILGKEANSRRWRAVLNDFKNVQGNNYYPQIYIPDYYNYQTKVGKPIIVFYLSDTPGPNGYVYTGYHIQDGELKPFGPVDEERLKSLRIWVMSINENVDNTGRVLDPGANMVRVNNTGKRGRIDKMAVYDPKESWAGGSSEIRVQAYLESWDGISGDGRADDFTTNRSSTSPAGIPLRSFTREEISEGRMVEVDYTLLEGWKTDEFLTDGVQLVFVIFEADTWPNTIGEASYSLANGDPRLVKYLSAQEYYDVGCVFGTKAPANWHSPAYPHGIPDSQLISNFSKRSPGLFISTEEY